MALTVIKRVSRTGHSLALMLTREMSILGIQEGDVVKVTIEREDVRP